MNFTNSFIYITSDSADAFVYLILSVIGFLLSIYITRAIFSIPAFLRHIKAQTLLLTNIAEKLGVDSNQARKIYYEAENMNFVPVKKSETPA